MSDFDITIIGINPQPWEIGPLSVGRARGGVFPKVGRAERLYTYQEAIKEEILLQQPEANGRFDDAEGLSLNFDFWRQLEQHQGKSRKQTGQRVDVTNLQKGTEDALQGILFPNDKVVKHVESYLHRQEVDVIPLIRIRISVMTPQEVADAAAEALYWESVREYRDGPDETSPLNDNSW